LESNGDLSLLLPKEILTELKQIVMPIKGAQKSLFLFLAKATNSSTNFSDIIPSTGNAWY
jgi:hypothetical protein